MGKQLLKVLRQCSQSCAAQDKNWVMDLINVRNYFVIGLDEKDGSSLGECQKENKCRRWDLFRESPLQIGIRREKRNTNIINQKRTWQFFFQSSMWKESRRGDDDISVQKDSLLLKVVKVGTFSYVAREWKEVFQISLVSTDSFCNDAVDKFKTSERIPCFRGNILEHKKRRLRDVQRHFSEFLSWRLCDTNVKVTEMNKKLKYLSISSHFLTHYIHLFTDTCYFWLQTFNAQTNKCQKWNELISYLPEFLYRDRDTR